MANQTDQNIEYERQLGLDGVNKDLESRVWLKAQLDFASRLVFGGTMVIRVSRKGMLPNYYLVG